MVCKDLEAHRNLRGHHHAKNILHRRGGCGSGLRRGLHVRNGRATNPRSQKQI